MLARSLGAAMLAAGAAILPAQAQDGFRWVAEPRFEDAGAAFGGVVPLREGERWGLMGADGAWAAQPMFEAVGRSGGERIAVRLAGKWGVADAAGRLVVPPLYDEIGTPSEVTPVRLDGRWIALDGAGAQLQGDIPIDTLAGNDGTCIAGLKDGVPVVDERGGTPRVTVGDRPAAIRRPSEGRVAVEQGDGWGDVYCGAPSLQAHPTFEELRPFSNDFAAARRDGVWGYISRYSTSWEFTPRFTAAREFADGLAPVQIEGGLWGYVNPFGDMAIEARFTEAYSFSDGLAGIRDGELRGFVATDGTVAVAPQFEDFWRHARGLAPVKLGGLWGVIAPDATAAPGHLDLPLAALRAEGPAQAEFSVLPSVPHLYFTQDYASFHSLWADPAGELLVTTLNEPQGEIEVGVWDLRSGRLVRKVAAPEASQSLMLPGNDLLAIGLRTGHLALTDPVSGRERHRLKPFDGAVIALASSADGRLLAGTDGARIAIWSQESGALLHRFDGKAVALSFSADGSQLFGGTRYGGMTIWQTDTGAPFLALPDQPLEGETVWDSEGLSAAVPTVAVSQDGAVAALRTVSLQGADGFFATSHSVTLTRPTARRTIPIDPPLRDILGLSLSGDGALLALSGLTPDGDETTVLDLYDAASGERIARHSLWEAADAEGRAIDRLIVSADRLGFLPDGDLMIVGEGGQDILRIEPRSGRVEAVIGEPLAFLATPQNGGGQKLFLFEGDEGTVALFDLATGELRRLAQFGGFSTETLFYEIDDMLVIHDVVFDRLVALDAATFAERALTPEEHAALLPRLDALWNVEITPELTARFQSPPGVREAGHVVDGGRIGVVRDEDNSLRVFDLERQELLVRLMMTRAGEWVALTPEGFFAGTAEGAKMVSVAHGLGAFSIDQVYQALYRPDLVREKLAGDPDGLVAAAAGQLNLAVVLDSGPAPRIRFDGLPQRGEAADEVIEMRASLFDAGGGIGRVEWRVNGRTVDVRARGAAPIAPSGGHEVAARLVLDPGDNLVELVAYNAADLIASPPATALVRWDGVASSEPPRLHVLTVGVNDYADGRLKLNFAAADARALAAAMTQTGEAIYASVEVTTLLDNEVTAAGLEAAFAGLSQAVQPQDVFVFFLAGHGKTLEGEYFYLPQDFRFAGGDPVREFGLGQDRLQEWVARIAARKSVLIFDTCESGSLTLAGLRGVDAALAQSAAVARLTRATGRTILSAATDTEPALEGYRGHGVLTYALLDGFDAADANANGTIEVTELAAFVDAQVPDISTRAFGFRQVPQMSIRGSDFPVVRQSRVLAGGEPAAPRYPETITHVATGGTVVHDAPGGNPVMEVPAGVFFGVHLIAEEGGWAHVAREGLALGYVRSEALMRLQYASAPAWRATA
ncbi:MAG: WG repeat-containing protein [Aquamicrobium sp.]|uniref:WG repeat-containing protein n=1 Tax=Aquamicrobium sp. TaxID=1872579 RepID=UPI00349ECB73|nr:WG repeat-containing protein [Aquamicrobium sp.]